MPSGICDVRGEGGREGRGGGRRREEQGGKEGRGGGRRRERGREMFGIYMYEISGTQTPLRSP